MSTSADDLKRRAAQDAVALVESGMLLGLGTGSTATLFVSAVGERLASGELKDIRAVPTSEATRRQASSLNIPLIELPEGGLDLAVDGMDELTPKLDAIKGLGGALLREKIVAAAAARLVLIGDASKLVAHLGQRAALPVEVARFGWRRTARELSALAEATLRVAEGEPFVSDNGNFIVDCRFLEPFDAVSLARTLDALPGVMSHGLFIGMADEALIAHEDGVRRLVPASAPAADPQTGAASEDAGQRRPSGGAPATSEVAP